MNKLSGWGGVFLDLGSIDNGDLNRSLFESSLAQWELHQYSAPEDIPGRLVGAKVVVTNKCVLDETVLAAAPDLRLIVLAATGANNIDLDAARSHGITVCNIRDYCSDSLAQHVVTLTLNLLTGQPEYLRRVADGQWSAARHFSLHDRIIRQAAGLTFAVVGFGSLGRATAKLAQGLGMNVMISERRGLPARPGRAPFEEVIRKADVISLHCPLTDETQNLISQVELAAMKPNALLINTARGGIVCETSLAEALRNGVIGGAAIDTLSIEPPPEDHPLLDPAIPNLLITPHNAWASRDARQAGLDQVARIIQSFLRGEVINQVN